MFKDAPMPGHLICKGKRSPRLSRVAACHRGRAAWAVRPAALWESHHLAIRCSEDSPFNVLLCFVGSYGLLCIKFSKGKLDRGRKASNVVTPH